MWRADSVERAHAAEFEMEDVKFTFVRDVAVSVGEIRIEAKEGEMVNIPRYAANVLEGQKAGKIQDTDMVVELKQASVKENAQGEFALATLEDHFYIRLKAYVKKLPEQDRDKVNSMLNTLMRKRRGKIVRLADASKLTADLSARLSVEERLFYTGLHEISSAFADRIMGSAGGDGGERQ